MTPELRELDRRVAEKLNWRWMGIDIHQRKTKNGEDVLEVLWFDPESFHPTINWELAGPLLEMIPEAVLAHRLDGWWDLHWRSRPPGQVTAGAACVVICKAFVSQP